MRFDKNHKVIIGTLNKDEAIPYITEFLPEESRRHKRCISVAHNEIVIRFLDNNAGSKAMVEFWQSAIHRHNKALENIDEREKTVKEKYDL